MVAKISSSNNLYGSLAYNQSKVDERHAQVVFTGNMIEPKDGNFDMHLCLQSFEPYLLANRRTEKPVIHISINPDPKDSLSDELLSEIAQTYMQKMGYGDQPFIVYKHEDIERKHIHIVSLRVDENGKKIDGNYERRRSMDVCRKLEQQYGLVPADRKQQQEGLLLKPADYTRGDIKRQIANVVRSVAHDYHFMGLKEYRALLTLYNIGVDEVRGEVKGKPYRGLVYSVLDDKGEKVGNPFKSSLFGKSAGMDALEKRAKESTEIIKSGRLKERSKRVISGAMQHFKNRKDFEKALQKQGISAVFRVNDGGRIYGATFIDHEQKCVFNGSRLGKEFSANVFNNLFNGAGNKPDTFQPDREQTFVLFEKSDKEYGEGSGIGGLFDLFSPESESSTADDMAEQSFIRRMKKKKKQKRQRRL